MADVEMYKIEIQIDPLPYCNARVRRRKVG